MKIQHILPVFIFALLLAGCGAKKNSTTPATDKNQPLITKLLVNELALSERPFTVLVPHATNRLFTFVKAIILGSCSTGGKCTFDKDLKSGTEKLKLTFPGQDVTHILKGDFVFLTGQKNMPDGKVIFEPSKLTAKENLIMLNSFGLPKPIDQGSLEVLLYPIVISSTNDKVISGSFTINQAGVSSAAIYDGSGYRPLKIAQKENVVTIALNQKPWSMKAEITRDDEKGSKESLTLYLLGPIVLYK